MFDKIYNLFKKNNAIINLLPTVRGKYIINANLAKNTWFGVGGPAEVLFLPEDISDLQVFYRLKPSFIPCCIIGGGANLLIRDGGIPGVVIRLDEKKFSSVNIDKTQITLGAGFKNSGLKNILLKHQIGGLEFISSIPGRIGGLIATNAGFGGTNISDVFIKARILNANGDIHEVFAEDFNFSYRNSFFPKDWIILDITIKGNLSTTEEITKTLSQQKEYRITHQPYKKRTAGSTFKNPAGLSAWKLIKDAGCVGLEVGGAQISDKHANFIINNGNATADDIETLALEVIKRVKDKTQITLEWEVKRMGVKK